MNTDESKTGCRRFRFRFGLRSLLLLTTAVAVLLSIEARRAHDQGQLAARLDDLGAQYSRTPRKWIPKSARRVLSPDQSQLIVDISVEGMQAPGLSRTASTVTMRLVEPAEIESLCAMPAMSRIRSIRLTGNAVTEDVLDELGALEHLEMATFHWTAIAPDALGEWAKAHPDCQVTYDPSSNGLETVACGALLVTEDLSLFIRADRGEPEAIRKLLHIAGDPRYERLRMLVDFLWRIDGDTALPLFKEAMQTGSAGTRQAVAELLGHLGEVGLLRELLNDPGTQVRTEAVLSIARIDSAASRQSLLVAATNSEPEVRVAALRELPKVVGHEALPCYLAALNDPHADVRWQAIYAVQQTADKTATSALIGTLTDEYSRNRCAAARALGKIADPRAISALQAAAAEHKDSFVREAASSALAECFRSPAPVEDASKTARRESK